LWRQKQTRNQGHSAPHRRHQRPGTGHPAALEIDLAAKTIEFKEKLAQGAPLDDLLIEAFAVVREAGVRFLGMRHFDVRLVGGIVR
jgi:hypothetical protein